MPDAAEVALECLKVAGSGQLLMLLRTVRSDSACPEAGARLAIDLGIRTSGDSLLRQLRRKARSLSTTSPRVLGIDDWAWRKGHRYGTILCDLERGVVVDLLSDRDSESVQNWLRAHPGAEVNQP